MGFHHVGGGQTVIGASYTDPDLEPFSGFEFLISSVSILTDAGGVGLDDPFLADLISPA